MLVQKRRVTVTLDLECYEDLDLENVDWCEALKLEGDECVCVEIKEQKDLFDY